MATTRIALAATLVIAGCTVGAKSAGSGSPGGDDAGGPDDTNTLPTYPTQHPRIYLGPNRARLAAALADDTPAAATFRAKVDAWVGGADLWGFQAWNAALLGQLTGDAKYCTAAIAAVESQVSDAEAAIARGTAPAVASDSYLGIGEMIGDLALVYDWCFDQVTADQRTRWLDYANQAVWNVWHPADAVWGAWSGWSTDNPSNNYYYSFLRATMLVGLASTGERSDADAWIAQFRDTKILGELVPTFDADLVGGASREGTGYGVAMRRLFELYDWWQATTGERLATRTQHTRASLLAFTHQVLPTLDRVAPTGDQSRDSTAALFDYHRNYLQELVTLFPTDPLAGRAQALLASSSVPAMASSFMAAYDFLYDNAGVAQRPLAELATAYHASGIGELYVRSGWDRHATWVNLIAGPYTESHAHQDQGSVLVYKDGWLAYDPVVDSRSGLDQRTTAHNVVRIDRGGAPVRQVAETTSQLLALHHNDGWTYTCADLTAAYNGDPAVQLVQRELVYLAPNVIVIFDRIRTTSDAAQVWQLAMPAQPAISGATATISNGAHALAVTRVLGGSYSTYDYRSDSDYLGGFRLDDTQPGGDRRHLHVLAIDGAVVSASAAGSYGVTLQLADGTSATVSFNRDAVGGTLTRNGTASALSPGLDALPE